MASWMVHLRIAEILIEEFKNLEKTEFIVGNISPDSGVPSSDWSYYTPSGKVSHFRDENKNIRIDKYIEKHFTKEMQESYNSRQYSFYLGYLIHLMTDIYWKENIADVCMEKHKKEAAEDISGFIWKMKADWYDLDFLYISKNPDCKAFEIYKNAEGFKNTYMDVFTEDAFDSRRKYIIEFYSGKRENLERDYPYLDERHMDQFVNETAGLLSGWMKENVKQAGR